MKNIVILIFFLFNFISVWSQDYYFVNAPSGLNVRAEVGTKASKIAKLPYGALVNIVETTNISYEVVEDGDIVLSEWVKIKYNNFPYLSTNDESYEWDKTGFVVKYYLQKLNKVTIKQDEVDSTTFYRLYKEPIAYAPVKLTSFEGVKTILSQSVQWGKSPNFEGEKAIDKIFLPSGQTLNMDKEVLDFSFVAYYPSEDIILFEGGHGSDFSISIKTGETLETVGNPEYIMHSPSSKFRLNGWFPGQECSTYFFQEKIGDTYAYLTEFDEDICNFNKFCWLDDSKFLYSYTDYSKDKGEEKYVIGVLGSEQEIENAIPNTFESPLRPNENLELGKVYKDTVNYVDFNDVDYDDRLFSVEKNKDTTILIYNTQLKTQLVEGDNIEISWKIDSLRPAGDPEFLDFRVHLVTYDIISSFKLKDKNVKALWRETQYNEAIDAEVNTMVLNREYINSISGAEKAALAYVATFIGNECEWDGKVTDSRRNLKCKIISSLELGYQCSDTHYGFLKKWFSKDVSVLDTLKTCVTIPNSATIQSTFDEISIQTNARNQTITIRYKVILSNLREDSVSRYTKTDIFQYNSGNLTLIDSEKIESD